MALIAACQPVAQEEPETVAEAPEQTAEAEVHWGYEGEEGPEFWADLSPDFAAFAKGSSSRPSI